MLLRLLRDGRSVGVVGAVSGGRSLLHPRWGCVAGCTFLLGRVDPLDAALAGLRAIDLVNDPPPGRAVRADDRREVQFVLATAADTASMGSRAGPRPGTGAAWRRVALPAVVRRCDTTHAPLAPGGAPPVHGTGAEAVGLGVGGDLGDAWFWRPAVHGHCLLVAGPARSGRSNTLRTIAHAVRCAGRAVAVVHPSGPVGPGWPTDTTHVGPNDAAALIRRRRLDLDLAVLVDDADRLADDAPVMPALREIVELADRDGGLVAVATRPASLATRFRGLDVEMAHHRVALLLNPTPDVWTVFDATVPPGIPRLPGRGVFVCAGDVTEVQVFLADGSLGSVVPGQHLGIGVAGEPGGPDRDDAEHDDQAAGEHPGPLHQAEPDGQQDHAPDEGGGARPGRGAQPTARQGGQGEGPDQDQQSRHQHPGGVTALPQDELDHVEGREAGQGECLHPGQQRGSSAGTAGAGG